MVSGIDRLNLCAFFTVDRAKRQDYEGSANYTLDDLINLHFRYSGLLS